MKNSVPIKYKKLSGIYCIKNLTNQKKYIGSTTHFQKRFSKHLFELKNGYHPSLHLQNSYEKYGSNSFEFTVVEIISKNIQNFEPKLLRTENKYIKYFKSNDKRFGYNLRISAESNFGITHSPKAKTRIKGKKLSEETKKRMSLSRQGIKHHSAKLTVKDVKLIKVLISQGYRNINIAQYFKINKSVVNDIKNNGSWSSVKITEEDINDFKNAEMNIPKQSRLNNNQVLTIKFLIEKNISNCLIARYCETDPKKIADIKVGKTYKHVNLDSGTFNELNDNFNFKYLEVLEKEKIEKQRLVNKEKALKGSKNPTSKLTEKEVLEIKKLIIQNRKLNEIAKLYNVTTDCISKIKSGDNWVHITGFEKTRTGILRGKKHPNFKHSDKTVIKIISLSKRGLSTKEICKQLDLEKTFVNRVKSGKIRNNITGIKPAANNV
jgi:group I intron endonuclease